MYGSLPHSQSSFIAILLTAVSACDFGCMHISISRKRTSEYIIYRRNRHYFHSINDYPLYNYRGLEKNIDEFA